MPFYLDASNIYIYIYFFRFVSNFLLNSCGNPFRLQIKKEKFFVDISGVLTAAMHWEERARHFLASESPMYAFEDALRL